MVTAARNQHFLSLACFFDLSLSHHPHTFPLQPRFSPALLRVLSLPSTHIPPPTKVLSSSPPGFITTIHTHSPSNQGSLQLSSGFYHYHPHTFPLQPRFSLALLRVLSLPSTHIPPPTKVLSGSPPGFITTIHTHSPSNQGSLWLSSGFYHYHPHTFPLQPRFSLALLRVLSLPSTHIPPPTKVLSSSPPGFITTIHTHSPSNQGSLWLSSGFYHYHPHTFPLQPRFSLALLRVLSLPSTHIPPPTKVLSGSPPGFITTIHTHSPSNQGSL